MSILNKLYVFFFIFCCTCLLAGRYDTEVRVGLNHYTDSLINEIYGKANFDVELEGHYQKNSHLTCFGNLNFAYQTGYSKYFDDKTQVKTLNLSLGPRFLFPICSNSTLIPYLGIGFTGSWIHTHDYGENIITIINRGAFGPCFKSGFMWERSTFYIDLFFDYYILYPKNSEKDYINFSQLKSGVGLGRKF
jgi:hypothetical protein